MVWDRDWSYIGGTHLNPINKAKWNGIEWNGENAVSLLPTIIYLDYTLSMRKSCPL